MLKRFSHTFTILQRVVTSTYLLGSTISSPLPANAALPLPLHIQGTQVMNSNNQPVWLRGVDAASMEWTSDGQGHILTTIHVAVKDWHANIIRLPLSQDRWFGKARGQQFKGKHYRTLIQKIVHTCNSLGSYIILDMHWSDEGVWGNQIGQHKMPDKNTLAFWKSFARVYRNYPGVLFDLYNEPHDISWQVWKYGGPVTENDRKTGKSMTYRAVGMQTLLNAVRSTGAKNVVVAGGINWAYDMTGFLNGYQLSDPNGNGVIYANHNYPFKGETFAQWLKEMKTATAKIPVIVSEFGANPNPPSNTNFIWIREVLQALESHHWNWTAWDMHPSASPDLINDWNYTPTSYFGIYVKEALDNTLPPYTAPPGAENNPSTPQ